MEDGLPDAALVNGLKSRSVYNTGASSQEPAADLISSSERPWMLREWQVTGSESRDFMT